MEEEGDKLIEEAYEAASRLQAYAVGLSQPHAEFVARVKTVFQNMEYLMNDLQFVKSCR